VTATGLFCFQPEARLRGGGMETKKPQLCAAKRGFFFGLLPKTDHEIILPPLQRKSLGSFAPRLFF